MISHLRDMAIQGLRQMFWPEAKLFVFRLRRNRNGIISEGLSHRYTAIVLIGLAGEGEATRASILVGTSMNDICSRLMKDVTKTNDLGDVALTLWAAQAIGYPDRKPLWDRLFVLNPMNKPYPTVEMAWALDALCMDAEAPMEDFRERLALRLMSSLNSRSSLFPHRVGADEGLRSHVSCFADLIYPIHALTQYYRYSGNTVALEIASTCAEKICKLQGPAGQWWWHYDFRTGSVIEPYPVYAVHQDAMAPMALFALQDATGRDFTHEIGRGLAWLIHSPELNGGSLIDSKSGLIWRKVGRRDPKKFVRTIQAAASKIHPSLRAPGIDILFPAGVVDYEDRPYHLGWLLYAWPPERGALFTPLESRIPSNGVS